ncbi:MAG TPA: HPr family phosphocarrier protein [Alphaproteobacteria bacterium]
MSRAPSPAARGVSRQVVIVNTKGLHARAAASFVRFADGFAAEVKVQSKGQTVSGHSIMGLMMLAAAKGTKITIRATGKDARAAVDALVRLVAAGFYEE